MEIRSSIQILCVVPILPYIQKIPNCKKLLSDVIFHYALKRVHVYYLLSWQAQRFMRSS
jgi:hypothetical protein